MRPSACQEAAGSGDAGAAVLLPLEMEASSALALSSSLRPSVWLRLLLAVLKPLRVGRCAELRPAGCRWPEREPAFPGAATPMRPHAPAALRPLWPCSEADGEPATAPQDRLAVTPPVAHAVIRSLCKTAGRRQTFHRR